MGLQRTLHIICLLLFTTFNVVMSRVNCKFFIYVAIYNRERHRRRALLQVRRVRGPDGADQLLRQGRQDGGGRRRRRLPRREDCQGRAKGLNA